jgi:lysophospholipase L1-like esterase
VAGPEYCLDRFLFLNWTDVCRRYDKDLLLWHEGYSALWRTPLYLFIEFLLRRHPPPKFVVIQLGSNDLGTIKGWQLAENIICDILRIHVLIPNTLIVWSDILQRRYWHNANNGKSIAKNS